MMKIKIDLSLENRLLKYCAHIDTSDITKNRIGKLLSNDLDWLYVLDKSLEEGISCLMYNGLLQFEYKVPENIWANLKEIYYTIAYRNTRIYQQMNVVFLSFNKSDLKVIPLKGIFLAEEVYKNISLRPISADVDLLVKKEDLPRIDRLLENLGYRTPIHKNLLSHAIEKSYLNSIDYFKTEEGPTLHIHWHIVNVTLPTYMYTKNIKMDRFWECARPTKLADAETLELAPHHLIMYLAEHALKHSFDRLILLADIDAVIKKYKDEIDWAQLIKETLEFGMERQVFYSLYFTNYFLDTEIPDYVLSKLKPKKIGYFERLFFDSVAHNRRDSKLCYFVYLNMVEGLINKSRFIFRTIFPPPSVLALTFNLNKPKVTIKDYLSFLNKQFSHLKKSIFLKSQSS